MRQNGGVRPLDPRLLRHARSARRHIALISALGLATALLVIVQALLVSGAAAPVIEGHATLEDSLPLIGALTLVVLARAGTVALREATGHRAADRAITELREAVLTRAEALGPRWRAVHASDTATLVTRGLGDLAPWFVKFLPQLILTCTVTPLALATILYLDFWSALIAALTMPLIPIFMILIGRFTQDSSRLKLAAMERLGSQLLDLMEGLPTLRALGREDGPRAHLDRLGRDNTRATMATLRVAFLSGGALEFLATLSVALVAVEVGMRLVYGNVDLFTGLAVIMLAPEVFEPLRQVGAQFHASANGVAAANAAFEIIEAEVPPTGTAPAPDMRRATLVVDDLHVAARGAWAPAGLDCTIHPGTSIALVGASGTGKTTTAMCLLGLERPTTGRVLARTEDGEADLADIDLTTWWPQVTWIPQHPTILPGTLRENLPPASEAALDAASRATGFDAVVADLPDGWETRVGAGGLGLSVGQRQRLALTRTFLEDSPLVVLDEPTAHLDAVTEDVVVRAIRELTDRGRTVVVIAHRSAVIAACDLRVDVSSRPATPEETARWPELTRSEELEDLEVTLPGFLDEALARTGGGAQ